jgi:hypothetical protein
MHKNIRHYFSQSELLFLMGYACGLVQQTTQPLANQSLSALRG